MKSLRFKPATSLRHQALERGIPRRVELWSWHRVQRYSRRGNQLRRSKVTRWSTNEPGTTYQARPEVDDATVRSSADLISTGRSDRPVQIAPGLECGLTALC